MRSLCALLIYFALVFIGGALLAPWLYLLTQSLGSRLPLFEPAAHAPFHRYVHRCFYAVALLCLWPLLRSLGLRSARALGLVSPVGQWEKARGGIGLGVFSLAFLVLLVLLGGGRSLDFDHTPADWLTRLSGALSAAVGAAVLEEFLFRGALFGGLRREMNWRAALLLSSVIFALLHFLQKPNSPGAVGWDSGLRLLPGMFQGLADFRSLVPGFFNLLLIGVILGVGYQRTGNLYFSTGLHGGWIFWKQTYGFLTRPVPGANTPIWGSGKLIDGWLALLVLVLALVICARMPVKAESESD